MIGRESPPPSRGGPTARVDGEEVAKVAARLPWCFTAVVPDDRSPVRCGGDRAQACHGSSPFRLDARIGAFQLEDERVPGTVEPAFPRPHGEAGGIRLACAAYPGGAADTLICFDDGQALMMGPYPACLVRGGEAGDDQPPTSQPMLRRMVPGTGSFNVNLRACRHCQS